MIESVRGSGGKGGGGGGHESDDTLFSTAYVEVIEAISEGQCVGLTNGGKSIYMNATPVIAADGTQNHKVSWESRTGWQGQEPFSAIQSVSAEQSVNMNVLKATPVVATISNTEADFAVVTVGFPRLMSADGSGNISGTEVKFSIECQSFGGSYHKVSRPRIKTVGTVLTGLYQSPLNTILAHIYLWSTQPTVDVFYSSDNANWTVAETVQLTRAKVGDAFYIASTTLDLPEGVHYLKWSIVNHAGATVSGPGYADNTAHWFSYGATGDITIKEKCMSKAQIQYRFALTGSAPWSIRLTRITDDTTSAKMVNEIWFDSLRTEVVARLNYPNTALMYYRIPAAEFNSIPRRRAEWKLLYMAVPSNYDPITRIYTGVWDGVFNYAWTDNPAWCFLDLCMSNRYGIGQYMTWAEIDKWSLYAIARYCDGQVDSGRRDDTGAIIYEPRFTLNILINQAKQAFEWLRDIASVFRGMMFVINGLLTTICDQPTDAVKIFNQANVINGQFTFSGTGSLARKTVALVQWQDPADLYNTKVEYVPDNAAIRRYGINPTEVVAVGCTSRGQAHRLGKWMLLDGEIVMFSIGHDAATVQPGDLVFCQIPLRSDGLRLGGRVRYMLGVTVILDAPVSLTAGRSYQLSIVLADGSYNSRAVIFSGSVTTDTLTIVSELDGDIVDDAIWVLVDMHDIKLTQWRILDIKEGEGFAVDITAMSHDPDKYAKIDTFDTDIAASVLPAINPLSIAAVSAVTIDNRPFTDLNGITQNKLHAHWPQVVMAARYQLRWRVNAGVWVNAPTLTGTLFEIIIKDDGVYEVEVVAVSVLGVLSSPARASATVAGEASVLNIDTQWSD